MAMQLILTPTAPPLRIEESGAVRVGDTRVLLELVIWAYQAGESAEEIVQAYTTLSLSDVHAVIAYYLRHKQAVEEYLAECKRIGDDNEAESRRRHADHYATMKARFDAKRAQG
jgi:uncharacterized protein (DUF433 family)